MASAFGREKKLPSTTVVFSGKCESKSAAEAEGYRGEDRDGAVAPENRRMDRLGGVLRLSSCLPCAL